MTTTVNPNHQQKYAGFISLVEATAAELYSEEAWSDANANDPIALDSMTTEVYDLAFERDPSKFEGIMWINSENGIPNWIRPGYDHAWEA
jgi:hypothetical protein